MGSECLKMLFFLRKNAVNKFYFSLQKIYLPITRERLSKLMRAIAANIILRFFKETVTKE